MYNITLYVGESDFRSHRCLDAYNMNLITVHAYAIDLTSHIGF